MTSNVVAAIGEVFVEPTHSRYNAITVGRLRFR